MKTKTTRLSITPRLARRLALDFVAQTLFTLLALEAISAQQWFAVWFFGTPAAFMTYTTYTDAKEWKQ